MLQLDPRVGHVLFGFGLADYRRLQPFFGLLLVGNRDRTLLHPVRKIAGEGAGAFSLGKAQRVLADPRAKAIIAKYAPTLVEFFTSGQAEGLVPAETPLTTLAQNPMAIGAGLNPENMKKISDELAAR